MSTSADVSTRYATLQRKHINYPSWMSDTDKERDRAENALAQGDTELVRFMIDTKGVRPSSRMLMQACEHGDLVLFKYLYELGAASLNTYHLDAAVAADNMPLVEHLILTRAGHAEAFLLHHDAATDRWRVWQNDNRRVQGFHRLDMDTIWTGNAMLSPLAGVSVKEAAPAEGAGTGTGTGTSDVKRLTLHAASQPLLRDAVITVGTSDNAVLFADYPWAVDRRELPRVTEVTHLTEETALLPVDTSTMGSGVYSPALNMKLLDEQYRGNTVVYVKFPLRLPAGDYWTIRPSLYEVYVYNASLGIVEVADMRKYSTPTKFGSACMMEETGLLFAYFGASRLYHYHVGPLFKEAEALHVDTALERLLFTLPSGAVVARNGDIVAREPRLEGLPEWVYHGRLVLNTKTGECVTAVGNSPVKWAVEAGVAVPRDAVSGDVRSVMPSGMALVKLSASPTDLRWMNMVSVMTFQACVPT